MSFFEKITDPIIADAINELTSLYDTDTLYWYARLWDPDVGAFYYSNTARDYEGFLPDVESTAQVLRSLESFCDIKNSTGVRGALPQQMVSALISFVSSMQSPDGYFYHKQWGKHIPISRRGRDLGWSTAILSMFGASAPYPTALERLESNIGGSDLSPHLSSRTAIFEYLESLDFPNRSYPAGNVINAQMKEIAAAGLISDVCDWLDDHQRPDNGLWQDGVNYVSVSGLMKLGSTYIAAGRAPRYIDRAIDSALASALSDERPGTICYVYNPLSAISTMRSALSQQGRASEAEKITARCREISLMLIERTIEKAKIFKKTDGSFSMLPDRVAPNSQSMPVAIPGTNEGDVNATTIAMRGVCGGVSSVLECDGLKLYTKENFDNFIEIIKSAKSVKKRPIPDGVVINHYKG